MANNTLTIAKDDARMTVIGKSFDDLPENSGNDWTEAGNLSHDIAEDLGYKFDDSFDFDKLAEDLGVDPSQINTIAVGDIEMDPDTGIMEFDGGGGGRWRSMTDDIAGEWVNLDIGDIGFPEDLLFKDFTGEGVYKDYKGHEYVKGKTSATKFLPVSQYMDIANKMKEMAEDDSGLAAYAIPQEVLDSLPIGGPLTSSVAVGYSEHIYHPAVYYYVQGSDSIIFRNGSFTHRDVKSGSITVIETNFRVHDSYVRTCYYSECLRPFYQFGGTSISSYLPAIYSGMTTSTGDPRNAYLCWQICFGSFNKYMISDPSGTAGDTSDFEKVKYNNQYYYKAKQADRL